MEVEGHEMSHSINVKGNVRARSYLEFQRAADSLQEVLRRIGNGWAEVWKFGVYFSVRDGDTIEQHVTEADSYLKLKNKEPAKFHLVFYCTSYRINMFRALLCPSSGARDYDVDYHIGRLVLGLLYVGG